MINRDGAIALLFEVCFSRHFGTDVSAREVPDRSKINRRIVKETIYRSTQPLYTFGPQAQTQVWAVLYKSKPLTESYDVLYFDRNADAGVTAADERIEAKVKDSSVTFKNGAFPDSHLGIIVGCLELPINLACRLAPGLAASNPDRRA